MSNNEIRPEPMELDEAIDAINAACEQGEKNAGRRNTAQRIANELRILQDMLATETSLRDTLVGLGQPEGFKTVKMQWFEERIASLQKLQGGA
jgi:hypothetical protein